MPLFVYRNNKTFKTIIDKTSLHDLKTNAKEGGLYQSTFYTKKKSRTENILYNQQQPL